MKKTLLFGALIGLLLAACNSPKTKEEGHIYKYGFNGSTISVFEYEGHDYVSKYHGGVVHSESCQCKAVQIVDDRDYPEDGYMVIVDGVHVGYFYKEDFTFEKL